MKSRFIAAMDILQEEASRGDLTLRRVFDVLGEEGHAVLLLFLCLPFLQPVPIPGLSTPLGFLIGVVAYFLYRNRSPWLPQRFEKLKISSEVLLRVSQIAENIWIRAAKVVRPRMTFLHDQWIFRTVNLWVMLVNSFLLALPLPIPFSNTVPAVAIIFSAIGHMEKDGFFILLSYLWCLIVVSFFVSLGVGAAHLI